MESLKISKGLARFANRIRLRYLGLGLMWSWIFCLWFSPAVFPNGGNGADATWLTSLACSAAVLILLSIRPGKEKPLSAPWLIIAPLGVSATTFAMVFFPMGNIVHVCAAIGGAFTAFLWVQWGELYSSIDGELMESCVPSSAVIVIPSVSLSAVLPHPVSGVFVALLPLAAGMLLMVCRGDETVGTFSFPLGNRHKGVIPLLLKLGILSAVCSMASSYILRSVSPATSFIYGPHMVYAVMAGALFAVGISLCAIFYAKRIDFNSLYQWVVPVLVFALCLTAIGNRATGAIASLLAFGVAFGTDCLFMIIFARISSKGWCTPSEAFGIFRGLVQTGCIAGTVICVKVVELGIDPLYPLLAFVCICVVALPVVSYLQEDLRSATNSVVRPLATTVENEEGYYSEMANTFRLSPREMDVLKLLAKGRSVPYMREVLVISKSTIETHIKHLYAKCEVHSKQELIDLVEKHRMQGESR